MLTNGGVELAAAAAAAAAGAVVLNALPLPCPRCCCPPPPDIGEDTGDSGDSDTELISSRRRCCGPDPSLPPLSSSSTGSARLLADGRCGTQVS